MCFHFWSQRSVRDLLFLPQFFPCAASELWKKIIDKRRRELYENKAFLAVWTVFICKKFFIRQLNSNVLTRYIYYFNISLYFTNYDTKVQRINHNHYNHCID